MIMILVECLGTLTSQVLLYTLYSDTFSIAEVSVVTHFKVKYFEICFISKYCI